MWKGKMIMTHTTVEKQIQMVPEEYLDEISAFIDYVIYNYNHNAIPKETLEEALDCYQLSFYDISDKIKICPEEEDDTNLEDMIGGLED